MLSRRFEAVRSTSKLNKLSILLCAGMAGPLCIFLSSYAGSFIGWFICIIGAYAVVNGLTYIAPVHHCWAWMPDKPGLVSGVVLAGVGLSSLFMNNIALGKYQLSKFKFRVHQSRAYRGC